MTRWTRSGQAPKRTGNNTEEALKAMDEIEEALKAARDFASEMAERKPFDQDLKRLVKLLDRALELRKLEKGLRG